MCGFAIKIKMRIIILVFMFKKNICISLGHCGSIGLQQCFYLIITMSFSHYNSVFT